MGERQDGAFYRRVNSGGPVLRRVHRLPLGAYRRQRPALHETPVYVEDKGWAFVDAVESRFRFADGSSLPFAEAGAVFLLPPAYLLPARPTGKPLEKQEVTQLQEVWVEPISADAALRDELRGWYHRKGRYVENEMGQRFYLDFYGSKWLAYQRAKQQ